MVCGLAAALSTALDVAAKGGRAEQIEDQEAAPAPPPAETTSLHFQSTVAVQAHPSFHAAYTGRNSMQPHTQTETAAVSTVFVDQRLWHGAELVFDPELSGGHGLSETRGVAAFPNGIAYRVGDPAPTLYVARLELRQTFDLGGGTLPLEAGPNQLGGEVARNRLTISLGRLAVTDVFDTNALAHDPQMQFFDWALFASGAWDYPADTRGYTWGAMADLAIDWWSVRAGIAMVPTRANGPELEWRLDRARGLMAEYEARYTVGGRRGHASVLVFMNDARMGSYDQVIDDRAGTGNDVVNTRRFGRKKYGCAFSWHQDISSWLGAFLRLSANDGANETWAFTEIDRSLAFGFVAAGKAWARKGDEAGAALVVNGLSSLHRRYLEGGGYGFIIGDGALNYAREMVGDIYYRAQITDAFALSAIYQPIVNPAYNRDRGPVHVLSGRFRVAF
jgi:high affinity Mn2+ porin